MMKDAPQRHKDFVELVGGFNYRSLVQACEMLSSRGDTQPVVVAEEVVGSTSDTLELEQRNVI